MKNYFEKYSFAKAEITEPVRSDVGIIVVIPCFAEEELVKSLESLKNCDSTTCSVEVIVVINSGENESKKILKINNYTFSETAEWIKQNKSDKIKFHLINADNLPFKHAGVGLARKIGMDEAARRFETINNPNGIIACFDADCTCDTNYLAEMERHFSVQPKSPACSVYFEHPVDGNDFSPQVYEGIIRYELFLRYYIQGLRYAQYPYAYHTIGSSMAVRSFVYQKQGGMNKRKAGEDFYFLHKVIPLGNFSELNSTKIIASPRPSLRVPFGTGKAVQKWLDTENDNVYHPTIFKDLKLFIEAIPVLYDNSAVIEELPKSIKKFLEENNIESKIKEIKNNSSSQEQFVKRFYKWMDGFRVLKYVHFSRNNFYGETGIANAANLLLEMKQEKKVPDLKGLLIFFRSLDRRDDVE